MFSPGEKNLFVESNYDVQVPINPYGKAKKMAEDIILDYSKTSDTAVMVLRSVH